MVALAVVGSPRAGNTRQAAEDLVAAYGGGDVVVLGSEGADVRPIGDCARCVAAGSCSLADDFDAVMARLYAADLLVLATPLYWYGPSGQLKAFLDRWSCLLDTQEAAFRARMRGKPAALVVAQGERGFYEAAPALQMLEWTLRYLDMPLAARVVVVGHARTDYAADAPQRQAVGEIGRRLASQPVAGDLLPPWFHVTRRPGTALGGIFDGRGTSTE